MAELTREQLIKDIELQLSRMNVPEKEEENAGPTFEHIFEVIRKISDGRVAVISRRYLRAILKELNNVRREGEGGRTVVVIPLNCQVSEYIHFEEIASPELGETIIDYKYGGLTMIATTLPTVETAIADLINKGRLKMRNKDAQILPRNQC